MKKILLHLSHTDIRYDSRILKEISALEVQEGCEVVGIGVELDDGMPSNKMKLKARIISIRLWSRLLEFLPRPVRYSLDMLEFTIRSLVYGLRIKPTIVHCHDTLALPAGVLIKMVSGCRLIYDAHELESNKNGQSVLLSKATLAIEKWAWKKIDLLISVSESINAWYVDNLGPKPHLLILNSPEISPGTEDGGTQRHKGRYFHSLYAIPPEKKIFIYIGILGEGRGIDLCLKAFTSHSVDAHIVFMGYGPLSAKIESYASRYRNIHLHNPVPHEKIVSIAQNADVGLCFVENVSLSDYYSLPNKLFEYAFSGLPVLASDFPEIRRVVSEYSLGFCSAVELDSIQEEVSRIVNGPLSIISEDLNALSWAVQATRLNEAYVRLLRSE